MGTGNIHDAFARETLSYNDNAACFFRGILPEDVGKKVNFESLQEEKNSYTDEKLAAEELLRHRDHLADLVAERTAELSQCLQA